MQDTFARARTRLSLHETIGNIFGWWLITLHSTITWLTLTRSLDGSDGQIKTLTLYSDPYPNTNQNPNPNHSPNPNPNVKFDFLPYMAMSRDITWPTQFLAHNFSDNHFNLTSCGVIRNQRSKIRRFNIVSTTGGPFRKISKFECRVIKHARIFLILYTRYHIVARRAWPVECVARAKVSCIQGHLVY